MVIRFNSINDFLHSIMVWIINYLSVHPFGMKLGPEEGGGAGIEGKVLKVLCSGYNCPDGVVSSRRVAYIPWDGRCPVRGCSPY